MPREIFGTQLPPAEESKISDIFHNQTTNETYVFDNGEWTLKEQEGDGSVEVVTINFATQTASMTASEIITAVRSGKLILGKFETHDIDVQGDYVGVYAWLSGSAIDKVGGVDEYTAEFTAATSYMGGPQIVSIMVDNDGSITATQIPLPTE